MKKLPPPKNCYALVVRYLIEYHSKGLSMRDVLKDYFYKFNTRLGEVEKSTSTTTGSSRSLLLKISRTPMTKKNRFGHPMTYTQYKSLAPMSYLLNLYEYLNNNKFKK